MQLPSDKGSKLMLVSTLYSSDIILGVETFRASTLFVETDSPMKSGVKVSTSTFSNYFIKELLEFGDF